MSTENPGSPGTDLPDDERLRRDVGTTDATDRSDPGAATIDGTDPDAAATLSNAGQQVGGPTLGRFTGQPHSDEPDGGTDPT